MPADRSDLNDLALTVRAAVDVLEAACRKGRDFGIPTYLAAPIAKAAFHADLAATGLETALALVAEPAPVDNDLRPEQEPRHGPDQHR